MGISVGVCEVKKYDDLWNLPFHSMLICHREDAGLVLTTTEGKEERRK